MQRQTFIGLPLSTKNSGFISMNVLIVKLGATGDVVRTTPLLRRMSGSITWITASKNCALLNGLVGNLRHFPWEERTRALDIPYDLVINLEDTREVALFVKSARPTEIFGAYVKEDGALRYTENARRWFDLSLISSYGRQGADRLKLLNRRTYQDLIFSGLGLRFTGDRYLLPSPMETGLSGDVAIATESGHVWPMKKWAYYGELRDALESRGFIVNILPERGSVLEHLADVGNHRCLVSGDSLPMHFALGTGTPCVTLFTCTSPWEIYEYGVQEKIVSPLLEEFFYKRGYDNRATTAISVGEVLDAVMAQLTPSRSVAVHATVS
jgi:heptosyltransferase II